ncbi:hypothetical protein BGZ76_001705 [Entomortierella beljakovae]|nr:hypothetical protein BGZ76_001705 [Entomortierella beljakovae]
MDSTSESLMQRHGMVIYVMGASGCGKSTVGKALSNSLGIQFFDGDDLHPKANVEKMASGHALTDEDRYPWLEKIRVTAQEICAKQQQQQQQQQQLEDPKINNGVVIACSALKKEYRDILRGIGSSLMTTTTIFIYLKGTREVLLKRMSDRQGHFMKSIMLDSQLDTLESPEGEEGVMTVSIEDSLEDQIKSVHKELTHSTSIE